MPAHDLTLHRFPDSLPNFSPIADDPIFNPAVHLALGQPERIYSLDELGYTPKQLTEPTPSSVAATDCFRILSDEGVAALYHVCKQLETHTTSNARISRNTRGGVYRSRFIRDLSLSPEIATHLSQLMQSPLLPHAMGHQLAHLNYQPLTVGENVDKWHYDTLQVDYVMFVTDPNVVDGGEFQYFSGTRDEMEALHAAGKSIPPERVIAPRMPGAGYAVLMQGNYVVHQARGLQSPGERITFVNGYSFADPAISDFTAFKQLRIVDPAETVDAEYARQMAYRSVQHLQACINTPHYGDTDATIEQLQRARAELDTAISALQDKNDEEIKHFGD
ncbi:MAG: hypothetical protein ACPGSC_09870 [Granulosicoccaceae bacterium]